MDRAISHKEAFGRVGGSFVEDPVWRPPRNWSALTFLSWPTTAPASHTLIADVAKVMSSRSVIVFTRPLFLPLIADAAKVTS